MIFTFKLIFLKLWEIPIIQLIIIFSIGGVFLWILLAIIKMVLLDAIYKKKAYRFVYDHFLPSILLISPWTLLLFYGLSYEFFLLSLIIYITIVVPSIRVLSLIRKWEVIDTEEEIRTFFSWKNPKVFVTLSVAIIYPLIYGLMFTVLRYLRMGEIVDISKIFTYYSIDTYIIFLVLFVWLFLFVVIISKNLLDFLWEQTLIIIYSLNVLFLKYDIYFSILEKLHKLHHILVCLIVVEHGGRIYYEKDIIPIWRKILSNLYWKPIKITYVVFLFTLVEGILTKHLHVSLYLLFYYNIMRSIFFGFSRFGLSSLVNTCNFADFFHHRFENPRYKNHFWLFFDYMQETPLAYALSPKELKHIETLKKNHMFSLSKRGINYHVFRLNYKIHRTNVHYHICTRIRGAYSTRWMHTEQFTKALSFYKKIFLINKDWNNIHTIQRLEKWEKLTKQFVYPQNIYLPMPSSNLWNPTNCKEIMKVIENNTPTQFYSLMLEKVRVKPYQGENVFFKAQPFPDVFMDFSKSNFDFKGQLTLDLKAGNVLYGNSIIVSNPKPGYYAQTLMNFKNYSLMQAPLNIQQEKAIFALLSIDTGKELTKDQLNELYLTWAANLHYFQANCIPPLRINENFTTSMLTEEAKQEYNITSQLMLKDHENNFFP